MTGIADGETVGADLGKVFPEGRDEGLQEIGFLGPIGIGDNELGKRQVVDDGLPDDGALLGINRGQGPQVQDRKAEPL